jgi:hypothetical protein
MGACTIVHALWEKVLKSPIESRLGRVTADNEIEIHR